MTKLKTAVCISGHLRRYQDNIGHLRAYLLNNPELECDVFLHTWRKLDRDGPRVLERDAFLLYGPKKMVVQETVDFEISPVMKQQNFNNRDIQGLLSMFYKIKLCNDLKSEYEKERGFIYDCVVRLRPDIKLRAPVPITAATNLNKLYIPKHGDYGGINDQFAYSNSHNMNIYSNMYMHINRYLQHGMLLNPEGFTLENIKESKFSVERPDIPYDIVWYNGHTWNNLTRHNPQ